jgi:hypothetical protein
MFVDEVEQSIMRKNELGFSHENSPSTLSICGLSQVLDIRNWREAEDASRPSGRALRTPNQQPGRGASVSCLVYFGTIWLQIMSRRRGENQ